MPTIRQARGAYWPDGGVQAWVRHRQRPRYETWQYQLRARRGASYLLGGVLVGLVARLLLGGPSVVVVLCAMWVALLLVVSLRLTQLSAELVAAHEQSYDAGVERPRQRARAG
jgi:hypothetical protein